MGTPYTFVEWTNLSPFDKYLWNTMCHALSESTEMSEITQRDQGRDWSAKRRVLGGLPSGSDWSEMGFRVWIGVCQAESQKDIFGATQRSNTKAWWWEYILCSGSYNSSGLTKQWHGEGQAWKQDWSREQESDHKGSCTKRAKEQGPCHGCWGAQ